MRKLLFILLLFMAVFAPVHQAQQALVDLNVSAGFDGRFREEMWMPLLVNITNNGDPVNGRLVVRPERAEALTNAFSTPVTLASGARQSVFLYVTMRSFGNTLRVELFNDQNQLVTETEVGVRSVNAQDHLHLVVTSATSSAVNFDGVSLIKSTGSPATFPIKRLPSEHSTPSSLPMSIPAHSPHRSAAPSVNGLRGVDTSLLPADPIGSPPPPDSPIFSHSSPPAAIRRQDSMNWRGWVAITNPNFQTKPSRQSADWRMTPAY
jgi:hypothetical protein